MKTNKKLCPSCGKKTLVRTIAGSRCSYCNYVNKQGSLFNLNRKPMSFEEKNDK